MEVVLFEHLGGLAGEVALDLHLQEVQLLQQEVLQLVHLLLAPLHLPVDLLVQLISLPSCPSCLIVCVVLPPSEPLLHQISCCHCIFLDVSLDPLQQLIEVIDLAESPC